MENCFSVSSPVLYVDWQVIADMMNPSGSAYMAERGAFTH